MNANQYNNITLYHDVKDISFELAQAQIYVLDAKEMPTLEKVWDKFADAFQFPSYFGRNFAALSDLLSEDELRNSDCRLIIFNAQDLLLNDLDSDLIILLDTLSFVYKIWQNYPITDHQGRKFDFAVALYSTEDNSRLSALFAEFKANQIEEARF